MRRIFVSGVLLAAACSEGTVPTSVARAEVGGSKKDPVLAAAQRSIEAGRETFRFDTFGDEAFWGDALRLHEAIAGAANGGVGDGVSPATALAVGLKVDVDALPRSLRSDLAHGRVDLDDPATTLALLQLDAVVGVKGFFGDDGRINSVGIQCALCHSTVDDSFDTGIGRRLDGWPNRDLDVGTIIALAPDLSPLTNLLGVDDATVREVLRSWGPGKFDAHLLLDGQSLPVVLPAAFGLAGVNLGTYIGWGSTTYWNAFVSNIEMGGLGTFFDPRLNDAERFPIAASAGFANIRDQPDRIAPKLADLHFYQLALPAPTPPADSFDAAAAARGKVLFEGTARCATCHVPPLYTEPGWNLHDAEEIGIDDVQAMRGPEGKYRTTPLRGLFTRMKGGFYHDGRFARLEDVVAHYDNHFQLGLEPAQEADLVEYLKSL